MSDSMRESGSLEQWKPTPATSGYIQSIAATTNPRFDAILQKMKAIHDKKSQDYATAANRYQNFESAATSAGTSVDAVFRTLIGVKLARLAELQGKGKTPQNESVADSLLDLAVYACLYASYYEKHPSQLASTNDPQLDMRAVPSRPRDLFTNG